MHNFARVILYVTPIAVVGLSVPSLAADRLSDAQLALMWAGATGNGNGNGNGNVGNNNGNGNSGNNNGNGNNGSNNGSGNSTDNNGNGTGTGASPSGPAPNLTTGGSLIAQQTTLFTWFPLQTTGFIRLPDLDSQTGRPLHYDAGAIPTQFNLPYGVMLNGVQVMAPR